MSDFTEIPILDFSLRESNKPLFLSQLKYHLINVGFLYLANHTVPLSLVDQIISFIPKLFELPKDVKEAMIMANSPHFLGYNRLGSELTKGKSDMREQFDFGSDGFQCKWTEGEEEYVKLWGPSQWPPEEFIPGFRATLAAYLSAVEDLSYEFTHLMAESFGLSPNALDVFFEKDRKDMQHRGKIVKYPPMTEAGKQGVGPHFDAGFLTFLLQASPHPGLQVQNPAGQWIPADPIDGTFIVNIGKGLELVTQRVALATSHRVISPTIPLAVNGHGNGHANGHANVLTGPRYSMPFFQNIRQKVKLAENVLDIPEDVLAIRNEREGSGKDGKRTDSVNFSEYDRLPAGLVNLIGRVKSHPDVGERHYPELFKQYFPQGRPEFGSAY